MWQIIMDWLRVRLGHHVCQEFTQWHRYERDVECYRMGPNERAIKEAGCVLVAERGFVSTYRFVWQERKCTICGKVEQRALTRGG